MLYGFPFGFLFLFRLSLSLSLFLSTPSILDDIIYHVCHAMLELDETYGACGLHNKGIDCSCLMVTSSQARPAFTLSFFFILFSVR